MKCKAPKASWQWIARLVPLPTAQSQSATWQVNLIQVREPQLNMLVRKSLPGSKLLLNITILLMIQPCFRLVIPIIISHKKSQTRNLCKI